MPPDTDQSAGEARTAAGTANHGCPESDGRGALHTTTYQHTDTKTLRQERQKKIALGHKEDDHTDDPTWQQSM